MRLAALAFGLTCCAAVYLYASPACREYYAALRGLASDRLSAADLRDASFIPVYTAVVGGVAGGSLGYWAITRYLGYSSGLGPNDATGLVLVTIVGAIAFGAAGFWCGEAVLSRRHRAT
jgi:hypothetical protein